MAGSTFVHTDTGANAIAHSVTMIGDAQLREVRLHLDSAASASDDLTVTIDSAGGALFDALLLTHDMEGITDLVQTYNPPILLYRGDTVVSAWANSGDNRNWGYQIIVDGR